MVESIHLRNELTWNKPMPLEFHAEMRKTYSLLTSIADLLRSGCAGGGDPRTVSGRWTGCDTGDAG